MNLAAITSKIAKIEQSKRLLLSRVLYLSILSILSRLPSAKAQLTPDGTLSTRVTSPNNQNFIIEDGDRTGSNLFHSFDEFSIPTNGSAVFNNATTIENIFSRVTGNNISAIDGLIQANGMANVFLLNPNGIVFGENASLNIGGSFIATTAEHILFGDATEFSAVDANSVPLLTVSAPVGLGLGATPQPITVEGPGHNLALDPMTLTPIRDNRPVGLEVNTGKTLALIGGDILVEGGNLTANQGRVELASLAQLGTVTFSPTTDGFTVDDDNLDRSGDIRFTEAASVEVSGEGSGNIHFQSGNLSVLDGSAIISNVLGADDGGKVHVQVSDAVEIQGQQNTLFPSFFLNQGELNSTGQVGEMFFDVGTLRIADGAQISNLITGQGSGSTLTVQANQVELSGISPPGLLPTGIAASTRPGSAGNAGNVDLQADTLQVAEGAQLSSGTFSQGDAGRLNLQVDTLQVIRGGQITSGTFGAGSGGDLTIQANQIELTGAQTDIPGVISFGAPSGIFATTEAAGGGNAGNIDIQVNTLQVTEGAQITSGTFGTGRGGGLTIQSNQIELTGALVLRNEVFSFARPSGIFASTETADGGNAGSIDLRADTLQVTEGAQIASRTRGQGNGGSIVIQANALQLSKVEPVFGFPSRIIVSTDAADGGNAGSINLQVDTLQVTEGGQIASRTRGQGDGGTIVIQSNDLQLSGLAPSGEFSSSISSSAQIGSAGNARNIDIQVEQLRVADEASISVSSLGEGNASDLDITADQIFLTDGGTLEAEVAAGDQGNILLTTENLLLLRREASISTNATNQATGGNIEIESPVIVGLENSDIIANAVEGDGGRINITTQGLLGLAFRDFQTTESDITASSDFGQSGTVDINLPDTEPNAEPVELPNDFEDASARIGQSLCAREGSAFTASGRGGLPASPYDSLNGQITWEDWYIAESPDDSVAVSVVFESARATASQESSATETSVALVEAQGWEVNQQGDVVFIAAVESDAGVRLSDGGSCRQVRQALR
ncbi:MAG: S-layer family protein [Cyanobacteria bacterium J06621_3]